MYVDGNNLRRIVCHLKVAPQTVAFWVNNLAEALPNALLPNEGKEAEMDELFTVYLPSLEIKNEIYMLTLVEPKTRCILGWAVVWVTSLSGASRSQVALFFSLPVRLGMCLTIICLLFISIVDSFTNNASQTMPLILWTSWANYFRHSPNLCVNVATF